MHDHDLFERARLRYEVEQVLLVKPSGVLVRDFRLRSYLSNLRELLTTCFVGRDEVT